MNLLCSWPKASKTNNKRKGTATRITSAKTEASTASMLKEAVAGTADTSKYLKAREEK